MNVSSNAIRDVAPLNSRKNLVPHGETKFSQEVYDNHIGEFGCPSCLHVFSSQGVALAAMVGWLTYGNKKFEALDSQMRTLIPPLRQAMLEFIPMVDADTNAFSGFMVS